MPVFDLFSKVVGKENVKASVGVPTRTTVMIPPFELSDSGTSHSLARPSVLNGLLGSWRIVLGGGFAKVSSGPFAKKEEVGA